MDYSSFENEYFKVLSKTNNTYKGRYLYEALCKICKCTFLATPSMLSKNKSCGCITKKNWEGFENEHVKILGINKEISTKRKKYWKAQCKNCGCIFDLRADGVENTKGCGSCKMLNFENENFKVTKKIRSDKYGVIYEAKCKHCDNGYVEVYGSRLKNIKSCGCLNKNKDIKDNQHYKIWKNAKNREALDESWHDYNIFYNDTYETYSVCKSEAINIDSLDKNYKISKNNYEWTETPMNLLNKNKNSTQNYFIGEKDERSIAAYNKGAFAKLILNHYNKGNSIRSVIKNEISSWLGWKFIEISENQYLKHIAEGGEFIETLFKFKLNDYFKFNKHLQLNKPCDKDRCDKLFLAYNGKTNKFYTSTNRKEFANTHNLSYECINNALSNKIHVHNHFVFTFIDKQSTEEQIKKEKELLEIKFKTYYNPKFEEDVISTEEMIGKIFKNDTSGEYKVIEYIKTNKSGRIFKIEFLNTKNIKNYNYASIVSGNHIFDKDAIEFNKKKEFIGKRFLNKRGEGYTVLDVFYKKGIYKFKIEFDEVFKRKFTTEVCETRIKNGEIKNPYYPVIDGKFCMGVPDIPKEDYSGLYRRWRGMLKRCYDPTNINYFNYGGRGVTVNETWWCFEDFLKDVITLKGFDKELEKIGRKLILDKDIICNELGMKTPIYSKDTCMWITPKENIDDILNRNKDKFKCINIITGDNFIALNQMETAKMLDINFKNLNAVLLGKRKHCNGWVFTYDLEKKLEDIDSSKFIIRKPKTIINVNI